jgi:hypothetical protein
MIALSHPLFREVLACAFHSDESCALDVLMGRPSSGDLWMALVVSASNGWVEAMRRLVDRAAEEKAELNLDSVLYYAALNGEIEAIREAIKLGATGFDSALAAAAATGQLKAMWELKAMQEEKYKRAMNTDNAWSAAIQRDQTAALDLLRQWKAKELAGLDKRVKLNE